MKSHRKHMPSPTKGPKTTGRLKVKPPHGMEGREERLKKEQAKVRRQMEATNRSRGLFSL